MSNSWISNFGSLPSPRSAATRSRSGWQEWARRQRRAGRIARDGSLIATTRNLRREQRHRRRYENRCRRFGRDVVTGKGSARPMVQLTLFDAEQFIRSFNRGRKTPARNSAICAVLLYLDLPVTEVLHMRTNDARIADLPGFGRRVLRRWLLFRRRLNLRYNNLLFPTTRSRSVEFGTVMSDSNLRWCLKRQSRRIGWSTVSPLALRLAGKRARTRAPTDTARSA